MQYCTIRIVLKMNKLSKDSGMNCDVAQSD